MIESKFVERIAGEVSVRPEQVAAAVALFDKGATVAFVARYRKDATGNLSEAQLERIERRNGEYTSLSNRRDAVVQNIEKLGKLDEDLRKKLDEVSDPLTLEDFYLPFRKQKRNKASMARDQGLDALADLIWAQESTQASLEELAAPFVNADKQVADVATALAGARFILAERISMDADTRLLLRQRMIDQGRIVSRQALKTVQPTETTETPEPAAGTEATVEKITAPPAEKRLLPPKAQAEIARGRFKPYHDFSEPVKSIRAHHLLAVLRGARLGALRVDLGVDDTALLALLRERIVKAPDSICAPTLAAAIEDAYRRLLRPALESEILDQVREAADEEVVWGFRKNARNLLLAPPAGRVPVMGIDPGLRSGCKVAVVDAAGAFVDNATLHTDSDEKREESARIILDLARKHQVQAIALGSGTGAREAGYFLERTLAAAEDVKACTVFVNEAGAAVYASSKAARDEFPEIDVTLRSAISIARRIQDPLAELVKVEPRSVGVGQYQHDVNQRMLRDGLCKTVESCVNFVGVDLNTAPVELLRYVSGVQMGTAQNIVAFRAEKGTFKNRQQLKEVPGIGEKTFEQCAGFLRIYGGDTPLDSTGIHPEAYPIVARIAESLSTSAEELIAHPEKLDGLDLAPFAADPCGPLGLADLRRELQHPGRDPRRRFRGPRFLSGVKSVEDLQEGMVTEGMITNVTDFGAFVDIGVLQDGLIHLSEIANRFVRDPRDYVQVGDVVRVKVVGVDKDTKRISLSIKALSTDSRRKPRRPDSRPQESKSPRPQQRTPDRPRQSAPVGRPNPPKGEGERPRQDRPKRRMGRDSKVGAPPARAPMRSGSEEPIGTSLADQLIALKEKFGGK